MRSAAKLAGLFALLGSVAGARAVTAQGTPPPTPSVTVGGVAYAQYLYQLKDTASHVNNFDITRSYINGLATRVTADIYRNGDNSLAYRLKYAYAAFTPGGSPLTFKLGEIHTPWLDWEEALWDYRMQGQMAMERGGYLSSSDFGAGVDGNWKKDLVNMQVGLYNGENYNRGTGDQRKDAMARVSARLLETDDVSRIGGLRLTGYGQVGKPTGGGIRDRWIGMLSYKSKMLTLAGEYARTKDRQDAPPAPATPTAEIEGEVMSFFGVVKIPNTRAAVIGRVDLTDPDKDVSNNRQTRFIGGVSYQLTPALRLLADVDNVGFQGDAPLAPAVYATKTQGLFQAQFVF
jgi:hypothetical protein